MRRVPGAPSYVPGLQQLSPNSIVEKREGAMIVSRPKLYNIHKIKTPARGEGGGGGGEGRKESLVERRQGTLTLFHVSRGSLL